MLFTSSVSLSFSQARIPHLSLSLSLSSPFLTVSLPCAKVCALYADPCMTTPPPARCRFFVLLAMSMGPPLDTGSTTLAAVSMLGTKLTYLELGDCKIYVFRRCHVTGVMFEHWASKPQRDTILSDGRALPNQAYMPSTASFTDPAYINSLMDKAVTDTINVQENDVVVMGSDGLWENMPDHMLLSKVSSSHAAGADPCTMAKFLVECAILARLHGENNFTVGRSAPIIGFPSPARKIPDPHPT